MGGVRTEAELRKSALTPDFCAFALALLNNRAKVRITKLLEQNLDRSVFMTVPFAFGPLWAEIDLRLETVIQRTVDIVLVP
jgi:hypothetical protein